MFVNAACGVEAQKRKTTFSINPDFQPYVNKFEEQIGELVEIDIEYNTLEEPVVGRCIKWTDGYRNIEIDPTYWPKHNNTQKEELLFHELGHCILDRDHDETIISADKYYSIPKSIMYPYVFEYEYYLYETYYINELKNPEILLTE